MKKFLVVGGAGFIGSHLVKFLEAGGSPVRVFDRKTGDEVHDMHRLIEAMRGVDVVVHLASNADIARGATNPSLDFFEGTVLTRNVAEAARLAHVPAIWYASGSGVYGDRGWYTCDEDEPIEPISHYGASKAAGEAILSAYSHMHGITVRAFRFANVVGPGQTHGVGHDFMQQMRERPTYLHVLGDGTASKSYLHVSDAIAAMLVAAPGDGYEVYNVATGDSLTVREIAGMAIDKFGARPTTGISFGLTRAGWVGDVPDVDLDCTKIRALGWQPHLTSRQAMHDALRAMR